MPIRRHLALSALLLQSACASHNNSAETTTAGAAVMPRPIVIAHRGASGHRPEHTIEAYALAIRMGADYIEPDLVMTRDRVLVARHENEIGGTTDVAEKFPSRRTTKIVDGDSVRGWFVEDFTFAELRTLRAKERLAARSHAFDGKFPVPSFAEVLALADTAGKRRGRVVGVYPELKHPTYFASIGLPLEEMLLATLTEFGLNTRNAPVFIQCFEVAPLREIHTKSSVRLILLLSGGEAPPDRKRAGDNRSGNTLMQPDGLREIAQYAFGVGLNTRMIVGADSAAKPTDAIVNAHAAGLAVHVWTLRKEAAYLPKRYGGDPLAEVREFQRLGVDGIFSDFPDVVMQGLGRKP